MKYAYSYVCALLLLCSCVKKAPDNCAEIQQVKITIDKKDYYTGDQIHIEVNQLPTIALFSWSHGANLTSISNQASYEVSYAEKADEGWYYLAVSHPDCTTQYDSVYITVKNKPAIPPCSPSNNTVSFTNYISNINPATVSWAFDGSTNRRIMEGRASGGSPDFKIHFNAYWNNTEPEDGEYSVTSYSATGSYPPYTVYVSSLSGGILFQGVSGSVYVSHVNGKIRVSLCNVLLTGSAGGPSYPTTASGVLTAP